MIPHIDQVSDCDHYLIIWIACNYMHYFFPGQAVAIGESLVAGKVRNPIWQYFPNKHHARFGTKVWLIGGSNTAYVYQCYSYEGANYDPSSKVAGSGYDVVIHLMKMT